MKSVLYYFTCGHVLPYPELQKFSVEGAKRYACPECREIVEYRTTQCQDSDCGLVFEISAIGQVPQYCVSCRLKRGIKLSHKASQTISTPVLTEATLKAKERSDCMHHYDCLTDAAIRNVRNLPCLHCEQYAPAERHYNPMTCRRCEGEAVYSLGGY